MTTTTDTVATVQVYRVYIKATPQAIWDAITQPEWTERYGYPIHSHYELRPGGQYRGLPAEAMKAAAAEHGFPIPEVCVDGEVIEADPPRRLVQTWRMLMDPGTAAEQFTRVTYEIDEKEGMTRLTVIHDLEGAPLTAVMVSGAGDDEDGGGGGGWAWILSDLKTLLETGSRLSD